MLTEKEKFKVYKYISSRGGPFPSPPTLSGRPDLHIYFFIVSTTHSGGKNLTSLREIQLCGLLFWLSCGNFEFYII